MGLIYKPEGAALEYVPDGYALNIYKGCTHHCTYCYNSLPRWSKDYFKDAAPKANLINNLVKELKTGKYVGKKIFMSFLSDVYQPAEKQLRLMPDVLYYLLKYDTIPVLLTKGIVPEDDWGLFIKFKEFHFGTTLVFMEYGNAIKIETHTPHPSIRIRQLIRAKTMGLKTWVSLEPIYDFLATKNIIIRTHEFVDHYKIGALNYFKTKMTNSDYLAFMAWFYAYAEEKKLNYYLKDSLKNFINKK